MTSKDEKTSRRRAWAAARLAVRSYARDPSDVNAARMRRAWLRIKEIQEHALVARSEPAAVSRPKSRPRA